MGRYYCESCGYSYDTKKAAEKCKRKHESCGFGVDYIYEKGLTFPVAIEITMRDGQIITYVRKRRLDKRLPNYCGNCRHEGCRDVCDRCEPLRFEGNHPINKWEPREPHEMIEPEQESETEPIEEVIRLDVVVEPKPKRRTNLLESKVCVFCGKEFKPNSNAAMYCSKECRRGAHGKA